ncbi:hypothetical protein HYV88_06125 [Candidatus Woesearchaeota archaeon]|nr:hypothetical protein [Candidatus Woesearchaeota archaeon]
MVKKCPQCKNDMGSVKFDIGYGIEVASLHCKKCGFNITDEKAMNAALALLRKQMTKEIKIINVGTGLGIRFPNEIVKNFKLKRGEEMLVKPEIDGLKIMPILKTNDSKESII